MPVDTPLYPTGLILAGRACLVVGGGDVAAGKVDGLRACGAKVHVVATRVGESVRARDDVTWEERPYRRGEVAGYRLVVAATGSPDVNRAVYEDGEAHGGRYARGLFQLFNSARGSRGTACTAAASHAMVVPSL